MTSTPASNPIKTSRTPKPQTPPDLLSEVKIINQQSCWPAYFTPFIIQDNNLINMTSRFNRDKFSNRATVKVPEDPIEQDTQSKQEEFAGVERNAQSEFASQDTQASRENVQPGEYAAPETAERRGTRYSFTHDQLADPDE